MIYIKQQTIQWPKDRGQTMIYKIQHRKLKIEQSLFVLFLLVIVLSVVWCKSLFVLYLLVIVLSVVWCKSLFVHRQYNGQKIEDKQWFTSNNRQYNDQKIKVIITVYGFEHTWWTFSVMHTKFDIYNTFLIYLRCRTYTMNMFKF
jgi:Na+-transporting methylmalonyl-CoA/oxaloacetate decarboxylase gamma subunit